MWREAKDTVGSGDGAVVRGSSGAGMAQGWGAGMAQWRERSPPTKWSGFDPQSRCHMWVEFLSLVLLLAPRGFSPGTQVFPSPQKPTFPNSNSIWNPRATGLSVPDC